MAAANEMQPSPDAIRDWSTPFITEESDPASHLEVSPEASVNDDSTADEGQVGEEISDAADETSPDLL